MNKNNFKFILFLLLFFFVLLILVFQTKIISSSDKNLINSENEKLKIESKSIIIGGGGVSKTSITPNTGKGELINRTNKVKNKYHEKYIRPNNTAPVVEFKEPLDNFISNNGDIEFSYVVHDDGLLKHCILYTDVDGIWQADKKNKNSFVQPDYQLHFYLKNLPDGDYKWNIFCEDDGSKFNTNNNFSFSVRKIPLKVSSIPDLSLKEDGILLLNLSEYFSDKKGDRLTYSVQDSKGFNIKISNETGIAIIEPKKNWFGDVSLIFTAFDEHGMKVDSNPIKITVFEQGDTPPRFTSLSPENNNVDDDGYIFVECNVTDDNGLKEVSLYSDTSGEWKLEETKELSETDVSVRFNITDLSNGEYEWSCLAKDNNGQETWSERQKVKVDVDVEIFSDIISWIVNTNVSSVRSIVLSYSGYMNNSLILGNLTIYEKNGEIYYQKEMSNSKRIEMKGKESPLILYVERFNINPYELFEDNYLIGNKEELNFTIEYFYQNKKYVKSKKYIIEILGGPLF